MPGLTLPANQTSQIAAGQLMSGRGSGITPYWPASGPAVRPDDWPWMTYATLLGVAGGVSRDGNSVVRAGSAGHRLRCESHSTLHNAFY